MKKFYLFITLLCVCSLGLFAQTPEKLNYQAIVRNSSDMILDNTNIGIQISILQTTASGSAVYVETQTPTTNANGLISIEIGTGAVVSGTFNTIDWGTDLYFIKTEIDLNGGSSYTITGTSQLMSVPYALYAKTSGSSTPGPKGDTGLTGNTGAAGPKGDTGADGNSAYQVWIADGNTGNEAAFLADIKGDTGAAGADGTDGTDGTPGVEYGDIKTGIQSADHNGWLLLDGRLLSTLTATQQTEAATLSLAGNLPDGRDKYLSYSPSGSSTFGSNAINLSKSNLPTDTFDGTTDYVDGGSGINQGDYGLIRKSISGHGTTAVSGDNVGSGSHPDLYTNPVDHNHDFSLQLNDTQTAIDNKPATLNVRMFIYLGE